MLVSVLVAVGVPLIFLYMIWSLELYAVARLHLVAASVVWGLAAFCTAYAIHSALVAAGLADYPAITLGIAPVLEETLKAAFLIWLGQQLALRYTVDGAVYGFAIGTGFALAENLLYVTGNAAYALDIAVARVLSTSLVHAVNTAIVGTLAGGTLYLGMRPRVSRLAVALALVIGAHALFNLLANHVEGVPLIVLGVAFGVGGAAVMVAVIGRSLRAETRWIERSLAGDVSGGELAAALNPHALARVLARERDVVGARRADLVRRYVRLLAQQAILRKTIALNQRPRALPALARQLALVEQQARAARSSMGLYTWLWLRRMLPSEESGTWATLDEELAADYPLLALLVELNERAERVPAKELAERRALLRAGSVFGQLDEEDLDDLALLLEERRFRIGETVIREGEVDDRLYVVADGGLVASALDALGAETVLHAYARGDTFGELSMLDLDAHPATVTAMEDVRLYALARADFVTLLYARPQVGLDMLRRLAGEVRRQTALLMWIQRTAAPGSEAPVPALRVVERRAAE